MLGPSSAPFLAAGDAHADEAEPFAAQRLGAPRGVGEQRIAAVDDDVAGLEKRQELVDDVVDRLARLDHDDDRARLRERGDEVGETLGRDEAALAAVLANQRVGARGVAVVERDAESLDARRCAPDWRP